MPEAVLDGCLQWSHHSSGHTGANRLVDFFRECFYSSRTLTKGGLACRPLLMLVAVTAASRAMVGIGD